MRTPSKSRSGVKSIKRRDGPFMLASFSPHDKSGVFLCHHRFKKQLCNSFSFNDTEAQRLYMRRCWKSLRRSDFLEKFLDLCSCTVPALMWRLFLIIQESTAAYSHTLSAGINATKLWWPCCLVANCVVSVNGWPFGWPLQDHLLQKDSFLWCCLFSAPAAAFICTDAAELVMESQWFMLANWRDQ